MPAPAFGPARLQLPCPALPSQMKTFGGVGVDAWGAVLLVCAVGCTALIYLWFTFLKWRAGRGRMGSVVSLGRRIVGAECCWGSMVHSAKEVADEVVMQGHDEARQQRARYFAHACMRGVLTQSSVGLKPHPSPQSAGQLRLAAARGRVQDLALLARLRDFQAGWGGWG